MGKVLAVTAMATLLLGVGACDTIGNPLEALSGARSSPDEFQVLARKPLRMPGSLELSEPRPGEPSPLEPDPETDAVIALLGAPVAQGVTGAPGGAGEQALLGAAQAASNNTEIRALLEQDRQAPAEGPYEPPSIIELFSDKEKLPEDAIDPAVEAQRLQSEGVAAAPIDPTLRPFDPEADAPKDPDLFYETDDGKPQNTLPSAPTETGF